MWIVVLTFLELNSIPQPKLNLIAGQLRHDDNSVNKGLFGCSASHYKVKICCDALAVDSNHINVLT